MRKPFTLLLTLGFAVALVLMGTPVSSHHGSRVDNRIVHPYNLPVVIHIPILAGYEPVPTPQHCLAGAPAGGTILYSQNFEGAHGYSFLGTPLAGGAANLWHATTGSIAGADTGHSGPTRLYFGSDASKDFSFGHVAGTARSPGIALPALGPTFLSFATKWNVEWLKGYDHLWVEAFVPATAKTHLLCTANAYDRGDASSSGDGHHIGSCSPVHAAPCPSQLGLAWENRMVQIPQALWGQTVQLQFTFDTADNVANKFMGWQVDDVKVHTGFVV